MPQVTRSLRIPFVVSLLMYLLGATPVFASPPQHIWSQRYGGPARDSGTSIAIDPAGSVIIAGAFEGTSNFGGVDLTSDGSWDVVLARYSTDGVHQWSYRLGGPDIAKPAAIAVDPMGDIVLGGVFMGTADFGGGNLVSAGSSDLFLAKYTAAGVHQWSRRFGGAGSDDPQALAVDGFGNIFVTGIFSDTLDVGGGPLACSGPADIFFAKYDPIGQHQWSYRFGGADIELVRRVTVDEAGNSAICGQFVGTVNFGGATLTNPGDFDMFVAKFDPNGLHHWSKAFGDTQNDYATAVAMDGSSAVTMTGSFRGTVNFGGMNLVGTGSKSNMVLAKYDSVGNHMWSREFEGTDNVGGGEITADEDGNSVVSGAFRGTVNFGGDDVVANVTSIWDTFVAKYDMNGVHQWSRGFQTEATGGALALDGAGNVFEAGTFIGTLNCGGAPLQSADRDIFLVKFGADAVTGIRQTPTSPVFSISAYPNPFNSSTTIRYTVPVRGRATVRIFDARGARVVTLTDGPVDAGTYAREWNGRDELGASVSSGVYFARIESISSARICKLVLLQ